MSHSQERISSYRRNFEGALASSPSFQIRVSSPSPIRRSNRGRKSGSGSGAIMSMSLCVSGATGELDAASAENQAFLDTRTTEKQEMITLNDRLTKYIEKVRSLESQNRSLEAEIEALRRGPSGLCMVYEERTREMRRVADQMMAQRDLAVAAKDAMGVQVEMLKARYSEALEAHKKAEAEIKAVRPDVDAATAGRITLEKQLVNLEHQLEFLQRVHKQEIEELMAEIYSWVAKGGMTFGLANLGPALKSIQAQYDSMATKKLQEMDAWYKTQFQDMSQKSTKRLESICSAREEIRGLKTKIRSKQGELDRLRTRSEVLEAKLRDATERYRNEEETLQARIDTFNQELSAIKSKIIVTLKEYEDLLNVKKSLEMEITTYRKLVEGENTRLNSMVSRLPLMGSAGMMAGGTLAIMAAEAAVESVPVSASSVSATEEIASVASELESAAVTSVVSDVVSEVETVVSEVENVVSEVETVVTEVETVASEVETVVTEVETVVSEVEAAVTEVETVVSEVEAAVTEVETVVSEVEAAVSEVETVVNDVANVVSEVEDVVNDVANGVSEVENGVNGESNGVSEVENGGNDESEASSAAEMEPEIVVKTITSSSSEEQAVETI
ncbi:desmin-like [Engraulis encrasicolus]|uniref:desmin-like n=1 Tax=Engraulis encrasicolus TaxID=184585 RepID=UPI002FD68C95